MMGATKSTQPLPPFRNDEISSVEMFVSGGQTGGDSIPLLVHDRLGVAVSGYMPRDFHRDDGRGREIAERYGLKEGEGGYSWRDKKNAAVSDALIAFLTSAPLTGKGTMSTANIFVAGEYSFVPLEKPEGADHLALDRGCRPVLVFWDIAEDRVERFADELRSFLEKHRPRRVMFAGSLERTLPGLETLGARVLLTAFSCHGDDGALESKKSTVGST